VRRGKRSFGADRANKARDFAKLVVGIIYTYIMCSEYRCGSGFFGSTVCETILS
jgi:hypothetical protein